MLIVEILSKLLELKYITIDNKYELKQSISTNGGMSDAQIPKNLFIKYALDAKSVHEGWAYLLLIQLIGIERVREMTKAEKALDEAQPQFDAILKDCAKQNGHIAQYQQGKINLCELFKRLNSEKPKPETRGK